MTGLNALLMSDTEVLITLAIFAAPCVMLMGLPADFTGFGRVGVKIAVCAGLAMAAVAGLAWSSIPVSPVATAVVVAAGG
jgi:hypothetical protein